MGMYREDNGKIFMRELVNMAPSEEYLIYDWSLNIGEIVYVQHGDSETGLVLDAITDTIINDEERRVLHLHYEGNTEEEIIGIRVMDVMGKTVYSDNNFTGGDVVLLNVNNGLYYVTVILKNGAMTEKIVIK